MNCVTGLDPAAYANPSGQLTTEQVNFYSVTGLDPAAYANPSGQLTTEQVKLY